MFYVCELMWLLRKLIDEFVLIIVMVVYDINMVVVYVDMIVVMKNGEIVMIGIFEEIIIIEYLKNIFGLDVEVLKY